MSNFGGFERGVARLLGRFPTFKKFAKHFYSRLVYFKEKKSYRYSSKFNFKPFPANENSVYFGYYDKTPDNSDGFVIAHSANQSTKNPPDVERSINLVVFNPNRVPLFTLKVHAYNWQQGCRAHWLNDHLLIFNDFEPDLKRYVSLVYSIRSKQEVKRFDFPVQDSFSTKYFLSLNYQRLMTLRPDYGYRNLPLMGRQQLNEIDKDGIWKVDYDTGKSILLVSIADACKLEPHTDFRDATHKVNHVMISPSGEKFIFMHRYLIGHRRFDRLILADAESGELQLLSDYGMVSHCFWADEETILGYLRGPGARDGYWLINLENGSFTTFAQGQLDRFGDGHPHVWGDWFITDTYPDKARMQHLILANWKTGKLEHLAEFFHGFQFEGESRCDLHPRFSPDGESVFFDSVFSGKRQLYRMELR